jgi:hypothetical protein
MTGRTREFASIAISVFFLFLGVLVLWLANKITKGGAGGNAALALLLVPVLLYLALSGRLRRIRVGGVEAEFPEVTAESVGGLRVAPSFSQAFVLAPTGQEVQTVAKASPSELETLLPSIDPSKLLVLTMVVESGSS